MPVQPWSLARLAVVEDQRDRGPVVLSSEARERQIFEGYTDAVAAFIAEAQGMARDDPEPWVIANALIGLHRALIDYVQRQALAGVPNRRIAQSLRTHGERVLALLEHGLG
jgi:hypothetical protein